MLSTSGATTLAVSREYVMLSWTISNSGPGTSTYKLPVYWLNVERARRTPTRKGTISQTIAERTFVDGKLGAPFSRSPDSEVRNNLHFTFPTIAVQLARKHQNFLSVFVPLARSASEIRHLDSGRHRYPGRMQRRGTLFGDPLCPREFRI